MATIRDKRPGVLEVRAFTGSDARGRPTQMLRTVRGALSQQMRWEWVAPNVASLARLLIESAIEITKRCDGSPALPEAATKMANGLTVGLDCDGREETESRRVVGFQA